MSLTKCLKTAGKSIDEQRVKALREEYLKDGLDPAEAGRLAAADYLTELQDERAALAARIEAEGGIVDSPSFSFAGANARAPKGIAPLEIAQAYLDEGVDSDAVRRLTGWFVGDYDGKWRFEINDSSAVLKMELDAIPESKIFSTEPDPVVRLEDVLDHPALYDAYPEARDISFVKRAGLFDFGGLQGWFNPGKNVIGVTPYAKDPLGTILHEVQHWIQGQEGFAEGGNEDSAIENLPPELLKELARDIVEKSEKKLAELSDTVDILKKLMASPAVVYARDRYRDSTMTKDWSSADPRAEYNALADAADEVFGPRGQGPRSAIRVSAIVRLASKKDPVSETVDELATLMREVALVKSGDVDALKKFSKAEGTAFAMYQRIAGEIEARNVPTRRTMTDEDRMTFAPRDTVEPEIQALDKKDIIVIFGKNGSNEITEVEPEFAEEVAASGQEAQFSRRGTAPKKTVKAYKLFKQKKDGNLYPLFIGKSAATPVGEWVDAEHIPTEGFAHRPGWHAGILPMAPHLRTKAGKIANGRVWAEVEIPDDVEWQTRADSTSTRDIRDAIPTGGHYRFKTSKMQGGAWIIGGSLKVNRILSDADVAQILTDAGHADQIEAETRSGVQFSRRRAGPPMPGQVRTGQSSPLPGQPAPTVMGTAPVGNAVSGQIPNRALPPQKKTRHQRLIDQINRTFSSPLSGLIQEAEFRVIRGLTHGRVEQADEVVADLNKQLSRMSEAQNSRAFHYLTTKNAPVPNLGNTQLEQIVKSLKATFKTLGEQMVQRGMIPQESLDTLGEAYLPRIYLIHLFGSAKEQAEIASGKMPDLSRTKKRKDIPAEMRELMGEVNNVAFLASVGVGQEMRDIALIDWLDEVAKNENWVLQEDLMEYDGRRMTPYALLSFAARLRDMSSYQGNDPVRQAATTAAADAMDAAARQHIRLHQRADAPKDFIAIPDTARYGNLRGLRVRRQIYNDIVAGRDAAAELTAVERLFAGGGEVGAKATSTFKEMKVVQNPASHVRNFTANGILLHLAGTPFAMVPVRLGQAFAALLSTNPRWTKYKALAKKHGLMSGTFASQELTKAKTEYRKYLFKHEVTGFKKIGHGIMIALSTAASPLRFLYQREEAVWKIAGLIHAMESKKMAAGDAAVWASKALMDYSDVTPTIRALRTSPYGMPFGTFTFKATARVLETAVTNPIRFTPYVVIAAVLGEVLLNSLGDDVDDDDLEALKKNMATWAQERASATILPGRDQYGRWRVVDFSAFLPWAQQVDALNLVSTGEWQKATKQVGLFGGPISSLIIAWNTGVDPFTERPIYNEWDENVTKLAKMTRYAVSMFIPPILSTAETSIGNKVLDTAYGRPSPTGEEPLTPGQVAARLAGVNVYPLVPFEQRKKNKARMKFEITQLKAQRTKVMRDQSLSDETKDKQWAKLTRRIEEKRDEMFKYMDESEIPASME